ncbi:hypothetical protein JHK85_006659 [Glycine max]|nr:hypothetical protein JHK85_006659 [Glycine max]
MADVLGKTLEEIKHHYELLIESGCVPLASYNSSPEGSTSHASDEGAGKKGGHSWNSNNESNHGTKASRSDQERRKGIAWTEDEHRWRRRRSTELSRCLSAMNTMLKLRQREQESLDGEEDNEKEKTAQRRRNILRYGGEGEEAKTCEMLECDEDDARVRRTRCSDVDRDLEGRRRLEEEESAKA